MCQNPWIEQQGFPSSKIADRLAEQHHHGEQPQPVAGIDVNLRLEAAKI